jgi:hypothetical protein
MTVICECGNADCAERIEVPVASYEQVRGDARLYVIAKGHEFEDAELVVEETDGYDVVQKREGAPAELARDLNPRS